MTASPALPRKYCLSFVLVASPFVHRCFPFPRRYPSLNIRPTRTTTDRARTDQARMGLAEGLITPRHVSLSKNRLLSSVSHFRSLSRPLFCALAVTCLRFPPFPLVSVLGSFFLVSCSRLCSSCSFPFLGFSISFLTLGLLSVLLSLAFISVFASDLSALCNCVSCSDLLFLLGFLGTCFGRFGMECGGGSGGGSRATRHERDGALSPAVPVHMSSLAIGAGEVALGLLAHESVRHPSRLGAYLGQTRLLAAFVKTFRVCSLRT